MFRALLAHLQEALHKQLVYCVRIMSAGCYQGWSGIYKNIKEKLHMTSAAIWYNKACKQKQEFHSNTGSSQPT
jgi:arginine/lysine/ornithine decarboxylase